MKRIISLLALLGCLIMMGCAPEQQTPTTPDTNAPATPPPAPAK